MSDNLDNLLVEAFSKSIFKDTNLQIVQEVEDGETDKEEGEIDSGDDEKERHKKSKNKSKHKSLKSKIDSKLKKVAKLENKIKKQLKSEVKQQNNETKCLVKKKITSKINSKSSKKPKIKSKNSSKTVSKSVSKSSPKAKKSKSSDKSEKPKDKNNDQNESQVMKLLLSKQLKSYADIQFRDEEEDQLPEKQPKKSKHKSSKKDGEKHKKHKKSKYSDEYYEKQKDSYYTSHSSTTHEDYFYGSYYEGTEYSSNRSGNKYEYSRPLSPLYESDWRQRSRSRSPIDYESQSHSRHRRRSMSPTERSYKDSRRSVTPFFKDGYTNVGGRKHRRSLSPSGRSIRSSSVASSSRHCLSESDKQKLFDIARNNLIKMIEKGDLPKGTDVNNLKLKHLRELTTKKSVQQWTEFCRAITTLESAAYNTDLDTDFDSDNEDAKSVASSVDQPLSIRHPANVNERKDIQIQMNIRGFRQLPNRSAKELAIELREQFPVSSGNQHRRKELEWHDVDLMPPPLALPAPKPKTKKIETALTEILKTPRNPPVEDPQIAYKIIPPTTATTSSTPTTSTTTTSSEVSDSTTTLTTTLTPIAVTPEIIPSSPEPVPPPEPLPVPPPPPPPPATETIISSATITADPIPSTSSETTNTIKNSDTVFPQSSMPIDIGSVMAQRLSAMRKLQEDPHNVVALKQMYQANQMMTEWAESKIVPGQFIGSTGANILSPQELSGNYNAWTRKDQLIKATPITEGIGMLLLLKMGWTPGQGLGKNNEGVIDPIMLEIKNDKKGLVAQEEQVRNLPLQLVSTTPLDGKPKSGLCAPGKNPVSILHELCAKKKWNQPEYELVNEMGPDHRKNFTFKVILNGVEYQPSVSSGNKKQAKALAAGVCLQAFGLLPKDSA